MTLLKKRCYTEQSKSTLSDLQDNKSLSFYFVDPRD